MVERSRSVQRGNATQAGCAKKKSLPRRARPRTWRLHAFFKKKNTLYARGGLEGEKKQVDSFRNITRGEIRLTRQIRSEWKPKLRGGWFCETPTGASPAFCPRGDQSEACPRDARSVGLSAHAGVLIICSTRKHTVHAVSLDKPTALEKIFLKFLSNNVVISYPQALVECVFIVFLSRVTL